MLKDNRGFSFSGLVYPMFLMVITLIIAIVTGVIITSFSYEKVRSNIMDVINDDNSPMALKNNMKRLMNYMDDNSDYAFKDGTARPYLSLTLNTNNWNGRTYTADGNKIGYIDNNSYCAFKLPNMSGIEVMNSGECIETMKLYEGIESLVCPPSSPQIITATSVPTLDAVPLNGTEGDIVIVSDVAVPENGFIMSRAVPEASEGRVWIGINDYPNFAVKHNNIIADASFVRQYKNGNWQEVTAYQYVNGIAKLLFFEPVHFNYTGSYQVFTAHTGGKYLFEAWGGQGNASLSKGAYIRGYINLNYDDKIYVYVGHGDNSGTPLYNNSTTFNGGYGTSGGVGGGGATDFRYFATTPTAAELVWDNIKGLTSRIMVAAGSGTGIGNNSIESGAGGELVGLPGGSRTYKDAPSGTTYGGHQTFAGISSNSAYGQGTFGVPRGGCAGGGGYYPGGGAACAGGSGGGSSYISGYLGAIAIQGLGNSAPKSGCTEKSSTVECSTHFTGKIFEKPEMIAGNKYMPNYYGEDIMQGNAGHGHAKITYLG